MGTCTMKPSWMIRSVSPGVYLLPPVRVISSISTPEYSPLAVSPHSPS